MTQAMREIDVTLPDLIAFLRVQIKRGNYGVRGDMGVATCPAELMLNIDAILDAAARGVAKGREP